MPTKTIAALVLASTLEIAVSVVAGLDGSAENPNEDTTANLYQLPNPVNATVK